MLCALLLLRLHSRTGVPILKRAVNDGSVWSAQAAAALAEAGVTDSALALIHRLRTMPLGESEEIETLLGALDRIEHSIPADIVTRLEGASLSPGARRSLEAAFSSDETRGQPG